MATIDPTALSARLAELAKQHGVVGASVAVLSGDTIHEAATGTANLRTGTPVSTDTIFQIGSITKVYTATLVMQLVDEGKVDLDVPIRTYLPDFRVADDAASSSVTTRQLLSHTSGIDGDFFDDFGRGDECIERYVEAMSGLTQTSEPGDFFSYCNAGYVLLGRLIEHFRGCVYDAALREHVLAPLGLTDVVTLPEEAILRPVAVGHQHDDDGSHVAPVWYLARASSPAGVVLSTARDLLAFARLHLSDGKAPDGTQVLSPASVKAMQQLQVELPEAHTLGEGWGLGWILYRLGTPAVIGHDGTTVGQQAYLRIVPEQGFAIALVTNGGLAPGALFRDLVRPTLAEHTGAELVPPALPPVPPVEVDPRPFLGVYERTAVRMEIRQDDAGDLFLDVTHTGPLAELSPPEPPTRLVPFDEARLLTAEPEDRLGMHLVIQFLGLGPDGYRHLHIGARATPRVSG
jgi:CubicO group peptidase (beta-lactamase class C family)